MATQPLLEAMSMAEGTGLLCVSNLGGDACGPGAVVGGADLDAIAHGA